MSDLKEPSPASTLSHDPARLTLRLLAWAGCAIFAWSGAAGTSQWTITGPALSVNAMAIDPTNSEILYAVAATAVARSDDGGLDWTIISVPDLLRPEVVRVSPSAPSVLYTATFNAVHRSSNAATTWTRHKGPKPDQFLNDLQVDPFNANTITVACSNFCLFGCSGGGVFRSDDGGESWKAAGLQNMNVRHLSLAATTSNVMYATTDEQVFRTINRGSSWTDVSPTGAGRIDGIAVDPANLKTVYISTESGIHRSRDSGDTWNLIRRADYGSSIGVARDGSQQLCVSAAGAASSSNQGDSWRELSTKGSNFAFNSLWDVVASRNSCFMVSDLVGLPGQILVYEIPRPRRRAASH